MSQQIINRCNYFLIIGHSLEHVNLQVISECHGLSLIEYFQAIPVCYAMFINHDSDPHHSSIFDKTW